GGAATVHRPAARRPPPRSNGAGATTGRRRRLGRHRRADRRYAAHPAGRAHVAGDLAVGPPASPGRGHPRPGCHPRPARRPGGRMGKGGGGRGEVGLGGPYGTLAERCERLEEALVVLRGLWTEASFSYEGRYVTVDAAPRIPTAQEPHPPIAVGGGGARKTPR